MALYVLTDNGEAVLVRARDGNVARVLLETPDAEVVRVHESGTDGVLAVLSVEPAGEPEADDEDEGRPLEIEITDLSDKGIARFKNLKTGEIRTEPRP